MKINSTTNFKGSIFKIDSQQLNSSHEDIIWKIVGNWDGTKIDSFNNNVYFGVKDKFFEPAKDILELNDLEYAHKQISDCQLEKNNITKLIKQLFKITNNN